MKLEARGLTRRLGGRTLFGGLDLTVEPGQVMVVRGPSGSGKTRLLRLLAWMDPPDSGRITLDGRDPEQWGACAWRAEVVWVPQAPPAMPGTPASYLEAVADLKVQRAREADDPMAIAERWGLPAEVWSRPWSELSGGERQRAALAVALARRPAVLLLDEPTGNLDPEATVAVEADLKGRSAVWVTHDDRQAERVADGLITLKAPS